MIERVALCAALAASIAAAPARAAAAPPTHRDARHGFEVRVPAGWTAAEGRQPVKSEELLAGWRGSDGQGMAVSRLDIRTPTLRRKRSAFFATLEAGLRDGRAGYERLHKKQRKLGRVRAFDLVFAHGQGADREVVAMRFLFFRRHVLALAVSIPASRWRKDRRLARAQLRSFRPYSK